MTDYESACQKRIDLEDVRPVAADGGTAILAWTYRMTTIGTEIDTGEVPSMWCEYALARGLLPEANEVAESTIVGVPGQ
jgi:hypothetical protein